MKFIKPVLCKKCKKKCNVKIPITAKFYCLRYVKK